MKTKNQKIEKWCREMGYDEAGTAIVLAIHPFNVKPLNAFTHCAIGAIISEGYIIKGVLDPDGNYHALPQFEDDKPEARDNWIQEYIDRLLAVDVYERRALRELNSRLLALEAKVLDEK